MGAEPLAKQSAWAVKLGPLRGRGSYRTPACIRSVCGADFTLWADNYGSTGLAASGCGTGGGIPEPACAILLLVGGAVLTAGRRRRSG